MLWAGWVMSLLPVPMLAMSFTFKITKAAPAVDGFSKMGYPAGALVPLGIVELLCTVLYLVPQTSVLGAILLTGYLGGAVDVHVRNGDPIAQVATPIVFGILVWGGLFLRDARIRALIPLRSK
ncbi:MAG: DoxX family protein [Candidatus Hydrogenedentes bacterium]|nr:DoxX family protein [Candidatus Hydrogenedentota bacterium]